MIGGYSAAPNDCRGEFEQMFNMEGEYKFAMWVVNSLHLYMFFIFSYMYIFSISFSLNWKHIFYYWIDQITLYVSLSSYMCLILYVSLILYNVSISLYIFLILYVLFSIIMSL